MIPADSLMDLRALVLDALGAKLAENGHGRVDFVDSSDLLELGVMDSQDLLDVILLVESQCAREFNPEGIELEGGLTVRKLINAFAC
jgi:acyl carrier protein